MQHLGLGLSQVGGVRVTIHSVCAWCGVVLQQGDETQPTSHGCCRGCGKKLEPSLFCSIDGCLNDSSDRGWCRKHYTRWKRHGDPNYTVNAMSLEERLRRNVEKDGPNGCWLWRGAKNNHGYGQTIRDGVRIYAHRASYEFHIGSIPEGLTLDHLCRTPACVNPAHLEPVSQEENIRRGSSPPAENARRDRCSAGHEFTPENTHMWGPDRRWRACRACARRRKREGYHRNPNRERRNELARKYYWKNKLEAAS